MMLFYMPQAMDQPDSMFKANMNIPDVYVGSDMHLHHGGGGKVTEQAPIWPALFEN